MHPIVGEAWYFTLDGVWWWVDTLFDTAVEVHTFQLGVLVGILTGILAAQNYPKTLALSLVLLAAFLLGVLEGTVVCATHTPTCTHIQVKPWYFLSGITITKLTVLTLHRKFATNEQSLPQRFGSKD